MLPFRATLWLLGRLEPPFDAIMTAYRAVTGEGRALPWLEPPPAEWEGTRPPDGSGYGRILVLRRARDGDGYPLTVVLVRPRLLVELLRAPEDVVIVQEFNLTSLFAVLSKVRRGRRVVALVEGDPAHLGATGRARLKRAYRRLVSRGIDAFAANGAGAAAYLRGALGVPGQRIVEGWWLAGLPAVPQVAPHDHDVPVLLTAGQLIERKGVDLLLEAASRLRCRLLIAGDGPQRAALEARATRLGLDATFLGRVPHARLAELLRECDLFVFPTRSDLVGRAVVEALSAGVPVVLSRHSGAAGTLVRDGENGLVVDPQDVEEFGAALRRATEELTRLRKGAAASAETLTPEAAAAVVRRAVETARSSAGGERRRMEPPGQRASSATSAGR